MPWSSEVQQWPSLSRILLSLAATAGPLRGPAHGSRALPRCTQRDLFGAH